MYFDLILIVFCCSGKLISELNFLQFKTDILAPKSGTRQAGKNTDFFLCAGPI